MRIFWFFFAFLFLLTLLSYAFIDPNFFPLSRIYSGFAFENRGWASLFYIVVMSFLYLGYLAIVRMYLKKRVNKAQIIGLFSISSVDRYGVCTLIALSLLLSLYIISPLPFSSFASLFPKIY